MTSKTQTVPLAAPLVMQRSAWPRRLKGLVLPVLILKFSKAHEMPEQAAAEAGE